MKWIRFKFLESESECSYYMQNKLRTFQSDVFLSVLFTMDELGKQL